MLRLFRFVSSHSNPSNTLFNLTPRAHRIGQQRVLHVYRLFVPGSIEERVLAGQREKLEVALGFRNYTKFHASNLKFQRRYLIRATLQMRKC